MSKNQFLKPRIIDVQRISVAVLLIAEHSNP